MIAQDCRKVLLDKQQELSTYRVRREDFAIEKNAEALDELQQSSDRVLALESLTRNRAMASLVSEALGRFDNGSYGICAECEEPISPKRLNAIPWAKYCIRCQDAADGAAPETYQWADAA